MKKLRPKDFIRLPVGSIWKKIEKEHVAERIMKVLAKNGNTWRKLPWKEYYEEIGTWCDDDRRYYDEVVEYTVSSEKASEVNFMWEEVYELWRKNEYRK